jgi:hypothetical protein
MLPMHHQEDRAKLFMTIPVLGVDCIIIVIGAMKLKARLLYQGLGSIHPAPEALLYYSGCSNGLLVRFGNLSNTPSGINTTAKILGRKSNKS